MKWFKHFADSHNDPDLSAAVSEFGPAAYMVFWLALEMYAKEFDHFDHETGVNVRVNWSDFRYKSGGIHTKTTLKLLEFFSKAGRIEYRVEEPYLYLHVPKFIELADKYTRDRMKRKKVSDLPETDQSMGPRSDLIRLEVDKNKDLGANAPCASEAAARCAGCNDKWRMKSKPKPGEHCNTCVRIWFEDIWGQYPVPKGKKKAESHFFARTTETGVRTEERWTAINTALENYLQTENVKRNIIMNASTFFNNWTDYIGYRDPGPSGKPAPNPPYFYADHKTREGYTVYCLVTEDGAHVMGEAMRPDGWLSTAREKWTKMGYPHAKESDQV